MASYVDGNNNVVVAYRTCIPDSGDDVIAEPEPGCAMSRCDAREGA